MARRWVFGTLSTLIFFRSVVLGGLVFCERDMLRVYLPMHSFLRQELWAGRLPQWFPFDGLGVPAIGATVAGLLHPLSLLEVLLPFFLGFSLRVLCCFVFAVVGLWLLIERLAGDQAKWAAPLGAIAYAFSGDLIGLTNNLAYLTAAATVPWALLASDRFFESSTARRLFVASGATALVLLAGDVLGFAVTLGLCVLVGVVRHGADAWRPALAYVVSVVGLSAVQLLPLLAIAQSSVASLNTLAVAEQWSLSPFMLIDAVIGPMFLDAQHGPLTSSALAVTGSVEFWVPSHWFGPLIALGAVLGVLTTFKTHRRVAAPFIAAWVALLLLALGRHAGLWSTLYELLPLFRGLRYPEKLAPFLVLGVCVSAGLGFGRLSTREQLGAASRSALIFACIVLGASVSKPYTGLVAGGVVLLLAAILFRIDRMQPLHRGYALALAQFVMVCVAMGGAFQAVDSSLFSRPSVLELADSSELGFGRSRLSSTLAAAGHFDDPTIDRSESAHLGMLNSVPSAVPALFGIESEDVYLPSASARLLKIHDPARFDAVFSAGYRLERQEEYAARPVPRPPTVATLAPLGAVLVKLPALPRAYFATPLVARSADDAAELLGSPSFVPGQTVVLESAVTQVPSECSSGRASLKTYVPSELELEAEAPSGCVLVINDALLPGWSATLDGADIDLHFANVAVRGVVWPGGRHTVGMRYRHPGLVLGSLITALFLVGLAGASRVRRASGSR